jgi:hypothetical protein
MHYVLICGFMSQFTYPTKSGPTSKAQDWNGWESLFCLQIVTQFKISHHGHGIRIHEITLPLMSIHGTNNFSCFGHGSHMPLFQGKNFFLLKKNANFVASSFTITWGIGKEATHSRMGCNDYKLKEHICWVATPTFLEGSEGCYNMTLQSFMVMWLCWMNLWINLRKTLHKVVDL